LEVEGGVDLLVEHLLVRPDVEQVAVNLRLLMHHELKLLLLDLHLPLIDTHPSNLLLFIHRHLRLLAWCHFLFEHCIKHRELMMVLIFLRKHLFIREVSILIKLTLFFFVIIVILVFYKSECLDLLGGVRLFDCTYNLSSLDRRTYSLSPSDGHLRLLDRFC